MSGAKSSDAVVVAAARWFWWIAGMSVVNTVLFYKGSHTSFVVGLGLVTWANLMLRAHHLRAAVVTAAIIGLYLLLGQQAQREKVWAFQAGLALYALDALIYVAYQGWMSVAFHALAGFFIFRGLARLRRRNKLPT